jgi:NAD(P)-dependent dehydrogenase (short-subunit alcohol dehydrogenase family)
VKVVVIGATGTIGRAVIDLLEARHEAVPVSRRGDPPVDLADVDSIASLFERVDGADAVVCCAASAPLGELGEVLDGIRPKLLGQVAVAVHAAAYLRDGGSITLTSGKLPEGTPGSAGGALVNAGIEAFVRTAALDLDRGLRINAVSPGWVAETLAQLGMDPAEGVPAQEVARAYVQAVEGTMHGEVLRPGDAG